ncbi:MAG: ribosome assembly cofactor RimP [Bacteroidota bacterium]|nr:ribosome assembly cofactor RimP [Bacteroidota bacterium]
MVSRERIIQILEDKDFDKDFFIVDVLIHGNNDIRIYIDNKKGISIRDCVSVSRFVEGKLLSEDLDFSLEVSSPGLDMPLKVAGQFKKSIGKMVEVVDLNGNKETGTLLKYDSEGIVLEQEINRKGKKETVVKEVALLFNKIKSTKILVSIK